MDKQLARVAQPEDDDIGIFGRIPEPNAIFYNRVIDGHNQQVLESARDRTLLPKALVNKYKNELRELRRALAKAGYERMKETQIDLKRQYGELRTLWLNAQNDDEKRQHARAGYDVYNQITALQAKLDVLRPTARRELGLSRKLDDHKAAVERKRRHQKMTQQMEKETKIFADIVIQTWSRLGYHYEYTLRGKTKTKLVKFSGAWVTPDTIQLKLLTSRLGLFGGSVDMLPQGVKATKLIDPETLRELSIACHRAVTSEETTNNGAWIIIHRLGTIDGIMDRVGLGSVLHYYPRSAREMLPLPIGVGVGRDLHWLHMAQHPHMLVGGYTGGGKSNLLRAIICTLAQEYSPAELRLVLVDLKENVEFAMFEALPHLLVPPVQNVESLLELLTRLETLRHQRAQELRRYLVRDISEYNQVSSNRMPRLVVIVDEFASIQAEKDKASVVQTLIGQILAKGRAMGIHLIITTQNPSVDILPGYSKANIGARIAFRMPTPAASATILGTGDASNLPAVKGRAVAMVGAEMIQVQTPYVSQADYERAMTAALAWGTPPKFELPEAELATAGFNDHDLIRVAIEFMDGSLGARPLFEFLKGEHAVTYTQIGQMVKNVIALKTVEYDGKVYAIKKKGNRYVLNCTTA